MVGWVFFRAENLTAALDYLKRMFVPYKTDVYSAYLSNEFMMVAALGLVSCGFLTLIFDKLPVKTEYKFVFCDWLIRPGVRLLLISACCFWPAIHIIRLFISGSRA